VNGRKNPMRRMSKDRKKKRLHRLLMILVMYGILMCKLHMLCASFLESLTGTV
jgi:hypothetical protein